MIDYFLAEDSPVTLEIKDNKGNLVRRYSSTDAPVLPDSKKLRIPELLDPSATVAFNTTRLASISLGHALHATTWH